MAGVKGRNGARTAVRSTDERSEADRLAIALEGDVTAVLRAISGSAVEELQLERDGVRISLRRPGTPIAAMDGADAASDGTPAEDATEASSSVEIRCLSVGIFHRSREPESPPLAAEGDRIEVGQAVGVVETLGMASEVTATQSGILGRFAVENEQPVEYGTVVAILEPE